MGFPAYTPSPVKLVTLSEADGDENLGSSTTNVSLEQLADGVAYLNDATASLATDKLDNHGASEHSGSIEAAGPITTDADLNTGGVVRWFGTQPAPNADPGENVSYATNQCKAWANVTFNAGVVTIHDGFNVSGITISGIDVEGVVTFARAMANANYAVTFGVETIDHQATINSKSTSGFDFNITKSSDASLRNLSSSGPYKVSFHVAGRQ